MEDFLGIALRISVMYIYVLALLRISGKRTIHSLSPLDFAVVTIIGDFFDDFLWSEVPLSQWLVGLSTIILLHTLTSFAARQSKWAHDVLESTPTLVVRAGSLVRKGMDRERTSRESVLSHLRLLGEDNPSEVQEANWEPDGNLSVIKTGPAQEVKKQDLDALKELFS